jgi:hypothetical protein
VSGESSKNWVSKFSIGCKDDACITNKQKESEALDHLEKHLLELVGTAPFNPKNRSNRMSGAGESHSLGISIKQLDL